MRGVYALPDTTFAVVGDRRQIWLLDLLLVAFLLMEALHGFDLSLAGRLSAIKRNVSLSGALDHPTLLLDSVEGAPFDLDLLSDQCCRRKIHALVTHLLLLATKLLLLLFFFFFATIFCFDLFIPVETAIILVAIEFPRPMFLENLPDVEPRSTLKMHNAVVCLVMHEHEHVHVTEERKLHGFLKKAFLSLAISDFSGAIALNACEHLNSSSTHFKQDVVV